VNGGSTRNVQSESATVIGYTNPMQTTKSRPYLSMLVLAAAVVLSGCVAVVGNKEGRPSNASLGQELMDLQKAKDAGAITDAEYQTQRARLLEHK